MFSPPFPMPPRSAVVVFAVVVVVAAAAFAALLPLSPLSALPETSMSCAMPFACVVLAHAVFVCVFWKR